MMRRPKTESSAASGLCWIDLGQWPPALAVTANERAYDRFMRAKQGADFSPFPSPGGGHTELMVNEKGLAFIIIAVGHDGDDDELICTVVHEAVHAARFLFHHVNETEPSKEAEAYLVEHIVRRALRHFRPPHQAQKTTPRPGS